MENGSDGSSVHSDTAAAHHDDLFSRSSSEGFPFVEHIDVVGDAEASFVDDVELTSDYNSNLHNELSAELSKVSEDDAKPSQLQHVFSESSFAVAPGSSSLVFAMLLPDLDEEMFRKEAILCKELCDTLDVELVAGLLGALPSKPAIEPRHHVVHKRKSVFEQLHLHSNVHGHETDISHCLDSMSSILDLFEALYTCFQLGDDKMNKDMKRLNYRFCHLEEQLRKASEHSAMLWESIRVTEEMRIRYITYIKTENLFLKKENDLQRVQIQTLEKVESELLAVVSFGSGTAPSPEPSERNYSAVPITSVRRSASPERSPESSTSFAKESLASYDRRGDIDFGKVLPGEFAAVASRTLELRLKHMRGLLEDSQNLASTRLEEIGGLQEKLLDMDATFRAKIYKLTNWTLNLSASIDEAEIKRQNLKDEISRLHARLEDAQRTIKDQHTQIQNLCQESKRTSRQLAKERRRADVTAQDLVRLAKSETTSKQAKIDELTATIESMKENHDVAIRSEQALSISHDAAIVKLMGLEEKVTTLKDKVETLTDRALKAEKCWRRDAQSFPQTQKNLAEALEQRQRLRADLDKSAKMVRDQSAEIQTLKASLAEVSKQKVEGERVLCSFAHETVQARFGAEQARQQAQEMQDHINELKKSKAALQNIMEDMIVDMEDMSGCAVRREARLAQKLEAVRGSKKAVERVSDVLVSELTSLQQSYQAVWTERSSLETHLSAKQSEKLGLHMRARNLESRLACMHLGMHQHTGLHNGVLPSAALPYLTTDAPATQPQSESPSSQPHRPASHPPEHPNRVRPTRSRHKTRRFVNNSGQVNDGNAVVSAWGEAPNVPGPSSQQQRNTPALNTKQQTSVPRNDSAAPVYKSMREGLVSGWDSVVSVSDNTAEGSVQSPDLRILDDVFIVGREESESRDIHRRADMIVRRMGSESRDRDRLSWDMGNGDEGGGVGFQERYRVRSGASGNIPGWLQATRGRPVVSDYLDEDIQYISQAIAKQRRIHHDQQASDVSRP